MIFTKVTELDVASLTAPERACARTVATALLLGPNVPGVFEGVDLGRKETNQLKAHTDALR